MTHSVENADPESKALRRIGRARVRFVRTARMRLQSLRQVSCGAGIRILALAIVNVIGSFGRGTAVNVEPRPAKRKLSKRNVRRGASSPPAGAGRFRRTPAPR